MSFRSPNLAHSNYGTVPKQNPLLAERREPSGIEEPESLRSAATNEIGKLFRDCSYVSGAIERDR